jgi:uncharacterized membrane protein (UPF0127 family)
MAILSSRWRFGALMLVAFALSASRAGAGRAEGALEKLEIDTAGGPRILQVEVMHSEQERERGLMFRKYLPKDRGMLFDFPVEEPIMMWMKNTYISLDMVFMDHNGRVVGIARNAEPLSETIIPSGAPAAGVLEINGGEAAALGIKKGDVVHHSMFKN